MSQHFINPKLGPGYLLTMEGFWAWFVTPTSLGGGSDGLMIFNHPGREYAIAQNYNHLQLSFTVTESPQGKAYPMGSRLAAPTDQPKFQVSVADRLGKKTPLLAHNTIIEVISSLADNSVSYSPLISHNAATTTFILSNSAKQNWAFVRVRDKATGAPLAVSAPIWFKQGGTALPTCNNGR